MKKTVLIASPIRRKPSILREFLASLKKLEQANLQLDFLFIDNNTESESSQLLSEFSKAGSNIIVWQEKTDDEYICDEQYHKWHNHLVWKVADFKNRFIDYALQQNYDYLFLVDSDLILQPKTVSHLVSLKKDIVAEVYWTSWTPGAVELPQVWTQDDYTLYQAHPGEVLSGEEIQRRMGSFLKQLKKPGTYRVGGLGACTLISRAALKKGVSFKNIYNLSWGGEDRHFCIRAVALGFDLWADTHYPPIHLYRESDLEKLS